MRLTLYTDYALRVLTYAGTNSDRLCSISEIATAYDVSRNHLVKVVHNLGKTGFIESVRGRSGGIRLARAASEIAIGEVVRHTEDGFALVDCGHCRIARGCRLTGIFDQAVAAFIAVLDGYTLADLVERPHEFNALLGGGRDLPSAPLSGSARAPRKGVGA
jgi:Rrf2 family transcriptional regulator, nitric oxide-sensitive transcriptional repressor